LHNTLRGTNHWVGFALEGTRSNRDAIGAKITLLGGNSKVVRWVTGGGSYLSSSEKRVVFGLGKEPPEKVSVEIRWPNGFAQTVRELPIDRYHQVKEPKA
jgi:hypothetical protein